MAHPTTHGRRAMFVVATLATVLLLITGPAPADAQTPPAGRVDLVDQSDWVVGNQAFSLGMTVDSAIPADRLEVVVTVSEPVANRSQFQQTLENRGFGSTVITERRPLEEVRGPDGIVRVDLPVRDPNQRRYFLEDNGVYPVRVELRSSMPTRTVDQFTTHLVNVAEPPPAESKLRVATIMPLSAPVNPAEPLALAAVGPLDVTANALRNQPRLPLTLKPSPEFVDRVSTEADAPARSSLTAVAEAHDGRPVLSSTWVPLSAPLFSDKLSAEMDRQFERGKSSLDPTFPNRDTVTATVTEPIDAAALGQWERRGARRILISESALAPAQGTTTSRPFAMSLGRSGRTLPAVQTDDRLTRHFLDGRGQVLGAHRAMADMAVIWNEAPGQPRGVAVSPPREWVANEDFYRVFTRALASSPVLAATTLDGVFELGSDGGGRGRIRQSATLPRAFVTEFPYERVNGLRRQINGLRSSTLPGSPLVDRLDRQLLFSESAALNTPDRNRALDSAGRAVSADTNAIRLPAERSIRLTARRGEVPVSVFNDTGEPVEVVARLSGDNVDFPQGSTRRLSVERQQLTERFTVDARTSGVFPVQIRLESPDGSIVYARSRVLIGSTATSALGVVLSVGAGAFLLLWWIKGLLKSRRETSS